MIFPDGLTITGKALDGMDNTTWTIGMTRAELNAYLAQGCAFLPASGSYESIGGWNGGGTHGEYWSAAGRDQYFTFFNNYLLPGTSMAYGNEKPDCYFSVRLVK